VVKISHIVFNGASLLRLDGFAPAERWEELSASNLDNPQVAWMTYTTPRSANTSLAHRGIGIAISMAGRKRTLGRPCCSVGPSKQLWERSFVAKIPEQPCSPSGPPARTMTCTIPTGTPGIACSARD
jgi:hypothetical protein